MSYTNKTANYDLPQWLADDKPTFLSDLNGAFSDIDTAMKANENAAASAQSTADANTLSINGITTDLDGAGGVKARLTAVETAESNLEGSVNTINSLIGNGTPTTTDQTIIGAINEIHAFTGEGPLDTTAQTVTGAINELVAGSGGSTVSITPTISTGTKIADYEIDGVAGELYAPAGSGSSSALTLKYTASQDGTKTNATLLNEVYTYISANYQVSDYHRLIVVRGGYFFKNVELEALTFTETHNTGSVISFQTASIASNASTLIRAAIETSGATFTDMSATAANVDIYLYELT